jgi:hypothetical protein
MNNEDFEHIFETQIDLSRSVLLAKSKEYANDQDRLHNFRVAAAFIQGTPEQALWGFLVKHLVSLSDMIPTSSDHPSGVYSTDLWDEKIGDAINYLILLRALVYERSEDYAPTRNIGAHHQPSSSWNDSTSGAQIYSTSNDPDINQQNSS